ncbi:MAG TPA: CBS domain-containing protein [Candidatus Limnocylindria bacterium]
MNVRDVMTREVTSVTADTPLRDLARLLTERQISGAPVVDVEGKCIGVISEADLLAKQLGRPQSRRVPLEWLLGERHDAEELRRRSAIRVGDAMSTPAVMIEADRPVREAAALMVDRAVNRLPVLAGGQLVGIVTRSDMVRAYLRQDADILNAVREKVLRKTMWLDPDDFDLDVREGVVRIAGVVDRRTTAGIIERLLGISDGVSEVQSALEWDWDDTRVEPAESEHEPGAASIAARERPRALSR